MKGFNISSYHDTGFATLLCKTYSQLGCDTIRYQLNCGDEKILTTRSRYINWLEGVSEGMVQVAYAAASYGLRFIADLHSTYGGVVVEPGGVATHATLKSLDMEQYWRDDVQTVADKIEPCPYIIGFEVMNEPHARVQNYAKFLTRNRDFLKACTDKRIYISSVHGDPYKLQYLPRLDKRFRATAHFWPTPTSLIGAGGYEANGNEEFVIKRGLFLKGLRTIKKSQGTRPFSKKILVGELGCTRGIGDELQVAYMRKALECCKNLNLDVIIHGEAGNPAYAYEDTGILGVIRECFGGK